jgi:hypothetical protein
MNEKIFLKPYILLHKCMIHISKIKANKQPLLRYDENRKHKEWTTKICWNLKEKRRKTKKFIDSCHKQVLHWMKIAKEQISLVIIKNTPKVIPQLECANKSPHFMEIFKEVAHTSFKKQYTTLSKNRGKYYITELYKSCER